MTAIARADSDISDIEDVQQEMIEEFSLFDDWMDRYQYIIDLGRKLPPFPEEYRTDEHKVHGCQSQVWMRAEQGDGRLTFMATSDSAIVCGLIALLLRVYSGRAPQAIMDTPPDFIRHIGLEEHLSPSRRNGLLAMIERMRALAGAAVAA